MSLDQHPSPARVELSSHACDICRRRKVKCNAPRPLPGASPPKCGRCDRLNLPCTFLSPSKTRGPKKREWSSLTCLRTRRAQPETAPLATTEGAQDAIVVQHPTDDLWDRGLFSIMMQDYLDYIYPLVPIVHRPSFRQALRENRDGEDPGFLALVIAIAAVVVATMPSRFLSYRSYSPPLRFASRREMARCCYDKIMGLRDSTYFDQINFQKFAISYLLYATFRQLGDHNTSRMLDVEATQIARLLNLRRISEYEGFNCIETQLRKKGFWLILYGFVLFWAALRSPCLETPVEPCPCVRARDPVVQVVCLQDRLQSLRYLLENIPCPLRPWQPTDETLDDATEGGRMAQELRSHFASMRTNLHVTHLWLQSLLIDQLEAAQSHLQGLSATEESYAPAAADPKPLWLEREKICRQLLFILYSLPLVNLEANGLHLACKVRDIAASLLECPFHPDEPEAQRAAEYLQQSTDVLSRLDSSESMTTMHLQTWVDTDRMKK
ncbi:hypothetical protein BO71DRAFT_468972 [Aspergillus ellipticus CBS 707.79]|uniref:Zn(2)-C6 fungal-type domain-containing protein n=1 Tax=Aspergillus ellipticus CBS 707.79 TaxID=1448320 RepID=A0A319DI32_9EURO|nr:hypothetical protein BO71DRAFT_468972 [Aspergillus ellipticus CBS 707.79]